MSGTSIDGIDAVLADFSNNEPPRLIATAERKWSDADKNLFNSLCSSGDNEIHRAGIAGNRYAEAAAEVVTTLLKNSNYTSSDIVAIASHGQTIRHEPENGFSVQIGNHALLAAKTGIDVICDFRSADLALGGQGAPLVPAFHKEILGSKEQSRFIVNIGGIANVTALIPNKPVIGFDTGPGNTLIDLLARTLLGKPNDPDGVTATRGKINDGILGLFLSENYFRLPPPKSTGRELFNSSFLNRCPFLHTLPVEDRFATITELTAITIINGINALGVRGEIYVCGGGSHNKYLIKRIEELAKQTGHSKVGTIDSLGVDPDFLEAFAFAWMGAKFVNREPLNMTGVTGASKPAILGCLYPRS